MQLEEMNYAVIMLNTNPCWC